MRIDTKRKCLGAVLVLVLFMAVLLSILTWVFALSAFADMTGTATSLQDKEAARWDVGDMVEDYNRDRDPNIGQWYGIFVWCVCASDRSKIYYLGTVALADDQAGPAVYRLKRFTRRHCGDCFKDPVIEYVEYGRKTAEARNQKIRQDKKRAANAMKKYFK